MHIYWYGEYCIKIQSKELTVVIDPYSQDTGLSSFRGKADIVALTNPADEKMSYVKGVSGDPMIMAGPGEYSIKGSTLMAVPWRDGDGSERTIQRWEIEGITILNLGSLNRELEDEELQKLEVTGIDLLFLPIGGGEGITLKQALTVMTTVEPRVVIPIHYGVKGLKEKLDGLDKFAKEMGVDAKSAEKKVVIKKSTLPQEDMITVLLSPAFIG